MLRLLPDKWFFGYFQQSDHCLAMRRLAFWAFFIGIGIGVCPLVATAQETETDSLKRRIEVLEARIDSLKAVIRELRREEPGDPEPSTQPKVVARFSGSGMKTTRPFSVPGPWEVRWETSAEVFSLFGFEAGNPNSTYPSMIAGPNPPTRGSSYVDRGGRYYLKVQSSGSWTVTVVRAN